MATPEFDFESLIELEIELEDVLGENHEVDGHDFGAGEMNIFIHTNRPRQALKLIKSSAQVKDSNPYVAAFRKIGSEAYEVLWPTNYNKEFTLV